MANVNNFKAIIEGKQYNRYKDIFEANKIDLVQN